jgi:hypothetical protein
MRVREENCNMVLLAVVTLFTAGIAGGATLVASAADRNPVHFAVRSARAEPAPPADTQIVNVGDQKAVRVIGAPFVPNTNPRER